jgi:hypothetical protein
MYSVTVSQWRVKTSLMEQVFHLGWAGCVPFTAFGANIIYDIVSVIQHSVIHY